MKKLSKLMAVLFTFALAGINLVLATPVVGGPGGG